MIKNLNSIFSGIGVAIVTPFDDKNNFDKDAVFQMHKYKIPASITMAQGILESNNGNSRLAVKGNNHFGIKCHDWTGKKMYEDDDKKNECFRKYNSALESFEASTGNVN